MTQVAKKINNMIIDQKLSDLTSDKEVIKKVLIYLKLSRMSPEEKKMRTAMLPYMEEQHIIKLADILEREVNEYTDLYVSSLSSAVGKPNDDSAIERNNE